MKHFLAFGAVALAMAFTACDNIDEDDRLIELPFEESDRVVLIEEFTGAKCVNCPNGAATVAALHERYGDQVVAVSLYPEQMTDLTAPVLPVPAMDLRTKDASDLFSRFNGPSLGLPAAMFNRTSSNGSVLQLSPAGWGAVVSDLLNPENVFYQAAGLKYPPLKISLTGNYDEASRTLDVDYTVDFIHPVAENVWLTLYLVENNIITFQLTPTGMNQNYENNHVLRTAFNENGMLGQPLGADHGRDSQVTGSASVTLNEGWKAENCQVVGFVTSTSGPVIDATLLKSIINK